MSDQSDQPDEATEAAEQPDEAADSPEDEETGSPAEGAQAAEKPEAGQVEEAAETVEEPDAEGEGGGAAADAPADMEAEKPQAEGGSSPADKSADDVAGGDTQMEPAQETLHGHPLVDSLGCAVVHTDRDGYLELCQALATDGYNLFVGLTCVDYLVHPGRQLPPEISPERFEVVVELASITTRRRLRVRCQVPGTEATLPTLFDVWPGSEAHERETYDMFGIVFEGHPDPSRILMPEDWEGHPLRKDYATGRIPVQFKESPGGR